MKKIVGLILIISSAYLSAQKTHDVQAKESAYSIAKKYNLSLDELYRLNPGLDGAKLSLGQKIRVSKSGIKAIPIEDKPTPNPINKSLGQIVVQPKQTLYGITRHYHISEKELVQLNPHIEGGMKIGDNLKIPADLLKKYGKETPDPIPTSVITPSNENKTYEVQAKDTFYGISKRFNITKEALLKLNPNLEEKGLQPGENITIAGKGKAIAETEKTSINPKNEVKEPVIAKNEGEYVVQEGDTVFSVLNKFELTWDQLLDLNPSLTNGLKTGMKLKISKTIATMAYKKTNNSPIHISLLLPLSLDSNHPQFKSMSLDFLTGAKLAASRYVASGKALNMKILDVGESSIIDKTLKDNNITETDLIIGPFFKSSIISVLEQVKAKQIPVVSPFANSADLYKYNNLIISETNKSVYAERIAKEVILSYSDETVYILCDSKNEDIATIISDELKSSHKISKISIVKSSNEIKLEKNMMTGQNTPISMILCSDMADLGNDFTNRVISLSDQSKGLKSFSVFYHPIFEKEESKLTNTKLVYLMDRKINTEGEDEQQILKEYKNIYCKSPSKYAIIGYDVVSDLLQRENEKAEIFKNLSKTQTQLATKFEYEKSKEGAYLNKAYRVIRLNP